MASGTSFRRHTSNVPDYPTSGGGAGLAPRDDWSLFIQRLGWAAAVFAVIVQQAAFISSPVLSNLVADPGSPDAQANVFNTFAIALNIIVLAPLCLRHHRRLVAILFDNKAAVALMALIFLSTAWSIHPDITVRRSVNYFSTLLTACYLAQEFDFDQIMKILAMGIAISAIGSFLFVAAFPIDAIHQPSQLQIENISGSWRGVFAHKNALGHAMTVGVIAELYILTSTKARTIWHVLLLCACSALVVLSRSTTAIILASFYLLGAGLLFLLQHMRRYFGITLAMLVITGLTIAAIYFVDPNAVWEVLGNDPTLTGRTILWSLIPQLISDKPLLGWGYSAMWIPTDPISIAISRAVGWTVPHAHNAILEVTLELGFVGLSIVLTFVGISLWRSVRCLLAGQYKLGLTSLVFFLGVIISGATESTLAQNQNIEWVVFNVLSFSCGLEVLRRQTGRGSATQFPAASRANS